MKKLIIISLLIPAAVAYAQDLEYVSSTLFSGHFNSFYIQGEYAFCGAENSFQILSISDPELPRLAWGFPFREEILDVAVLGEYAFFAPVHQFHNSYFRSFDISQPFDLIQLDSVFIYGDINPIIISGDYAFAMDSPIGFAVVDISNPSELDYITEFETPGNAYGMFVYGNYAYIADGYLGLQVVDISDFQNITIVGNYATLSNANSVIVRDSIAYLAEGTVDILPGKLTIVNVSNPSMPSFLGECSSMGYFYKLAIKNNYAYVISYREFGSDLLIINISQPQAPFLTGSYNVSTSLRDIYVNYPYCFVSGGNPEFNVFNIADPQNPLPIGDFDLPVYNTNIYFDNNYLFTASENGLWIIDISDHEMPTIIGNLETPSYIRGIFKYGAYAYTYINGEGLAIIDVSYPSTPSIIGTYPTDVFNSITVSGDYAYLACDDDSLVIVNITDPTNPFYSGGISLPDIACDIISYGEYVYVANSYNGGLQIINVHDPSNPVISGSLVTPGGALGVHVEGNIAFIADGDSGLHIINIQDPSNPDFYSSIVTNDFARDVSVSGNYAVVADDDAGVQVIDFSDPINPSAVIFYDTPGRAWNCLFNSDYIYLSDLNSIMILYFDRETGTLEHGASAPSNFNLSQNYPNPFNVSTTIGYDVPIASAMVIEIFDILGRKVETLYSGFRSPGSYTAVWNADNMSSGLYFYRLRADDYVDIKRMLLIK